MFTGHYYCNVGSLRSKRFRRFFRPSEVFFAFWRRENWGERNTNGGAAKKRKMSRTGGKTYGNACYAGYNVGTFLAIVTKDA